VKKRIAIGLLVGIGVFVASYAVSQPKEGTLEWHKAQYICAMKKVTRDTAWDRILQFVNRHTGTALRTTLTTGILETKSVVTIKHFSDWGAW